MWGSPRKSYIGLSGRSGRGHLVLLCAQRRRPRPLLKVNKLRRRSIAPSMAMGMAKSDFSQMHHSRSDLIINAKLFAQIDLD